MHISAIHFATNYTWGSGGSPTWQAITDFLLQAVKQCAIILSSDQEKQAKALSNELIELLSKK